MSENDIGNTWQQYTVPPGNGKSLFKKKTKPSGTCRIGKFVLYAYLVIPAFFSKDSKIFVTALGYCHMPFTTALYLMNILIYLRLLSFSINRLPLFELGNLILVWDFVDGKRK